LGVLKHMTNNDFRLQDAGTIPYPPSLLNKAKTLFFVSTHASQSRRR
jgi:hypothetical protein